MELSSPAYTYGSSIPATYTCSGRGVSPPLAIHGVPDNAQSLALLVHDPDAPSGDFIHWTVWNILPDTADIDEGTAPAGAAEGSNDFGKTGYGAPCPPSGTHRYFFELYALDTAPVLESGAPLSDIAPLLEKHTLAKATLMGTVSAA